MNAKVNGTLAAYFGLPVEVLCLMECCSLICFQGQEFIVETADLVFSHGLKQAA